MEPSRFDDLTKALATATSRRQALKTIAATTLGSILGLGGIGTAFGKKPPCHRNGTGCDTNDNCCSHYCSNGKCTCPPAPACNSYCPCGSGQTCLPNGSCCPNDQVCGSSCGCPQGQTCQNGTCCAAEFGSNCMVDSDCCSGVCCFGHCCSSGEVCCPTGDCGVLSGGFCIT